VQTALTLLVGAAFLAAVVGAVQVWRRQFEAGRLEDLRALAARRGWSLNVTGERLGRSGTLRLASRGGHPWVLEVGRSQDRPEAAPATIYASPEPRWAGGTLVLHGATLTEGATAAPAWLLGAEASRLPPLSLLPSPEGVTLAADADPQARLDLSDIGIVLGAWPRIQGGERGAPVLVLGPQGLRLGLRQPLRRADRIERFVDLALELSRVIGP
jgi:hypothetical protein